MQYAASFQNGNGNGNGNGHKNVLKKPISFMSRLFNIAPSQWPRVSECWFITFFFKVGFAIGWTVLTAAFVGEFGIAFLPTLFVLNAGLIMLSTFFFEQLIMRIKREILMILMVLIAALCLFFASFLYDRSAIAFFSLVIFAESIFLAQFNVFIPILVGDRFTPLESQRTFPFIESADTIAGMIGGSIVGIFADRIGISWFLYLWIAALICIIVVFVVTRSFRINVPPLPFRATAVSREHSGDQIKQVFRGIKKMPFLKGLIAIVLLQWVFMNLLEFQYTKAVEQSVTHKVESTIASSGPNFSQAAVLSSPDGIKNLATVNPERGTRALSLKEQASLAKKLGELKGIFYAGALIIQSLFASRLITSLGIVGSMLLHPVIMLMSLVGMFLKFGFLSSAITKMNFEITNVVHKNAYFASHYAMPRSIRDQAAEFLEGIVRPMGTILSMLAILGLQFAFSGRDLTMWIHMIMFVIMAGILISTIRLQSNYTKITRDQLFSDLPYPEKLNAIEILAQRGHKNAPLILMQKFQETSAENSTESRIVRMRLLSALGQSGDYNALPEILDALKDSNPEVRLEAAHALLNFRDIGEQFYTQAFSRFHMIERLKDLFRHEKSEAVRNAIIRVFSLIHEPSTVSFLLGVLAESSQELKADCIYTLGLFHDPCAAYYVVPFLKDPHPRIRANALIALWQFRKYRPLLENTILEMMQSRDPAVLEAAIFAIGEIGLSSQQKPLQQFLNVSSQEIRLEAAYTLIKLADPSGFEILLEHVLSSSDEEFYELRMFFTRLKPKARKMLEILLIHAIAQLFTPLIKGDRDSIVLVHLKRLYTILDQHEELFAIEAALAKIPVPMQEPHATLMS